MKYIPSLREHNFCSPEMSVLGAVTSVMTAWCLSCSVLFLAQYCGAATARIGSEGNSLLEVVEYKPRVLPN